VVDTWAFAEPYDSENVEYLSMQHTRASLCKLVPERGDIMTSSRRRDMLSVLSDTTDGTHDTLIAACDRWRYEELSAPDGHRNCADNLVEALAELGEFSTYSYLSGYRDGWTTRGIRLQYLP
jgi:uncharacterized protein YcgI (DUF1989 family)